MAGLLLWHGVWHGTVSYKSSQSNVGLWCWLVGCQSSLFLSEIWCVMILSLKVLESTAFFELLLTVLLSCLGQISSKKNLGGGSWLVEKENLFNCKFKIYISTGWMCSTYLCSDVFYSFWSWLSSRQHLVNINFFNWNICLWCFYLFIYSFC